MNNNQNKVIPLNEQIIRSFEAIGGKNFIKQSIKELDTNRSIFLLYSDKKSIQFHTKINPFIDKVGFVIGSKQSLIDLYNGFYDTLHDRDIDLLPTEENMRIVIKSIVAHEVGHILDDSIVDNSTNYLESIVNIAHYVKDANFDMSKFITCRVIIRDDILNNKVLDIKKLMVERESKAWTIAKQIIIFDNKHEEKVFNLLKEYALATYNTIDMNFIATFYDQIKPLHKWLDRAFEC